MKYNNGEFKQIYVESPLTEEQIQEEEKKETISNICKYLLATAVAIIIALIYMNIGK